MDDFLDRFGPVFFISAVFVVVYIGIGTLIGIGKHMSFPGQIAQIEQLRQDATNVRVGSSEDVVGQVTQWNQTIAKYKRYNKIWWSALFVPNDWDKVELIPLPKE